MTEREKELDRIAKLLVRRDLALTEANERLIAMDKAKSEFVSIAAHQLRTPLTAVKWTLNMIMAGDMGKISKEQQEFLQKGYKTNERMIRLVNDLLNVARIEEGRFGYKFEKIDLIELIEEIVQWNQKNFKAKNLQLEFIKPKYSLSKIRTDPERLRLAIQNILDNAYHYTITGGVAVILERKNNQVQISIKDTGIGIPQEQMSRLFEKFFRGSNIMRKGMGPEGTGLGLYIAKNIIEAHDGEIGFESTENQGSVFWFTLPLI
ncbi:MAG: hypothetical protein COX44_00855 [Candidatus Portnoybacteria bacterium CG23_combo_of_CG06-09_8_20_14_all_37_13]|uniref:histidine kinase n=1 Tax=Candidatus Portnoybacteria bacterium CG23_combo_of_CG06-09_8_20_14_all_37_13 TaxID=1974819 RepID=A0A2G9YEV3_9BACT|nr:MAG: hypothetical protein COX44_00855 [Candidatus Portnoybacteria bacterium CG23_combo_of_CG06-09_8_20_14_all_37_13]